MLDIHYIRENANAVQENTRLKGYDIDIQELLKWDEARRTLQQRADDLRQARNELADRLKAGRPAQADIDAGRTIKSELSSCEASLREAEENFYKLLKQVPNMALSSVPVGHSEDENVVIREIGTLPSFDFVPQDHATLAENKGWLDAERAAKVAGSRFVYVKGDLARLEFALWQFAIDSLTDQDIISRIIADANLVVSDKPFTFVLPPAVAKTAVFEATGRLNKQEQTYKLEGEDLWLNASAEHTLAPMYLDEILSEEDLPIRMLGYTTAFRREAGTYGKDTTGMFRLHQFDKLEMESFTLPEAALDEHLFLIAVQEYLMRCLGLPYRVIEKCTADIGRPNAKGVDIEVWLPSQQQYRETHTADYLSDYQTRAMKTRVRRHSGELDLAHTNDATAFSQRPLIGIIENNQTASGDVNVPEVLRAYLGGRSVL